MFTTTLQDSQLEIINNIIKVIKSDFIYITNQGKVYGFNKDFTVIREVNMVYPELPECIFRVLDYNAFIKSKCENIQMKYGCKSELIPYNFGNKPSEDFLYSGMYLKNTLDNMIINKDISLANGNLIYKTTDFKQDLEFKGICTAPSSKGVVLMSKYGIYLYKGLVPFSAKDDVHFTLLKYSQCVVAIFEVHKSKGIVVTTFINYLDLNN